MVGKDRAMNTTVPANGTMPVAKAVLICILIAAVGAFAGQPARAQAEPARGARVGQSVTLRNPLGDRQLRVTVLEFVDPIKIEGNGNRGFRFVAAHLEVANPGQRPFRFDGTELMLLDDAGVYAFNQAYRYSEATLADYEPLDLERLAPGETETGWLVFEISTEAQPSAVIYFSGSLPPYFGLLAWIDPVPPDASGGYQILDQSGKERGTISVDYIIPELEQLDSDITPQRGLTTIGLVVTITNRGDARWRLPGENFWIVDQFGQYYSPVGYDRSFPSFEKLPDLALWAAPNVTVQGVLMFEMPRDSVFTNFLYTEGSAQMYVLGGPDPALTLTGEDTLDRASITKRQSLDTPCEGVQEWAAASASTSRVAADAAVYAQEGAESGSPEQVRSAVTQLELALEEQRKLVVPDPAQEIQGQLLELLQMTIDALNGAIDRMEAGQDASEQLKALGAPNSPNALLAKDAAVNLFALMAECGLT
jgi:hypothetical protein